MEATDPKALVLAPPAQALARAAGAPNVSRAATELLQEIDIVDERGEIRHISLPREKPLTVQLDGRELVTLMTLGAAPEWLVLGYLCNQRLVSDIRDLESIEVDWPTAIARVKSFDSAGLPSRGAPGTACSLGSVYNDLMRSVEDIELPSIETARISRSELLGILETMRIEDAIHRAAGSVHSCALFQAGALWIAVEDVSRHNGVDTVTGWMKLHAVAGADKVLFTTGRLTGEMVVKAALSGIPILVTRNGATAMGYEIALRLGMTLFCRAANRRFLCYCGMQRFDTAS
jgi:FdhD protein